MTTIPTINLTDLNASITSLKGSLVYDYNPLRVFKIDSPNMQYSNYILNEWEALQDLFSGTSYIILSNTGKYDTLVSDGNTLSILGEEVSIPYLKRNYLCNQDTIAIFKENIESGDKWVGKIDNLDTSLLNFDITRPLIIDAQDSYDGTVNLIYNDNYSIPKLINTRFAPIGDNKYQIIDREGQDDTNLYPQNSFESSIALQKITKGIVDIEFRGVNGNGNLPVGNYVFYFKLSDEDQNPTDFIGESSVVTCHKGNLLDPFSTEGGVEDQNSHKQVHFVLKNIDSAYNRVIVYYTRTTSTSTGVLQVEHKMLGESYDIYNGSANITITGYEPTYDVDESEINASYEIIGSAKAQAICSNRLFLGNIKKPEINTKALKNLALHFYPYVIRQSIGTVDKDYNIFSGEDGIYPGEYYNTKNIYHYTGYWNDEIYRFGIVFIMNDGSLSPVFNIRGRCNVTTQEEQASPAVNDVKALRLFPSNDTFDLDDPDILDYIYEIPYDLDHYTINNEAYRESVNNTIFTNLENAKGVFNINSKESQLTSTDSYAYGIRITVDDKRVIKILQSFTKGYFIVRQKRLATTLCQAITIGTDRVSHLPLLPVPQGYLTEGFLDSNITLNNSFQARTIIGSNAIPGSAALCPEYELRQNYFNTLFTSTNYSAQLALDQYTDYTLDSTNNYFYPTNNYTLSNKDYLGKVYIQAVPDSTSAIKNKTLVYSSKAGEAEEAKRFSYVFNKRKTEKNTSIARGAWSPYLGLESKKIGTIENIRRVDIKMPDYSSSNLEDMFHIRYQDSNPFFAVSERKSFDDYNITINPNYTVESIDLIDVFRGDCYICNFTHRMVRNFQDPSFPVNDDILDTETWKTHYKLKTKGKTSSDQEQTVTFRISKDGDVTSTNEDIDLAETAKINRGDVNAVKIGHWVTFKIMSNLNLSMRSIDETHIDEMAVTHKGRTFYPLYPMSVEGTNKVPESAIINEGYGRTVSDQNRFMSKEVPAERTDFSTRIMYSELGINGSISNNLRIFKSGNHQDYSSNYGQLVKMVPMGSYIMCIFEHGIGMVEINERAAISQQENKQVYIKSVNVLPERMAMLSTDFGTQWPESVIQTPTAVYGVDTVAKVIWRASSSAFEVLSDFKVQNFLNNNISLSIQETSPIIGIRNVKSHYNAFKKDVIFTFYDDINTIEDKVWSLCYNEDTNIKAFTTFYSWVPSYSANIDNIFFTFDRQASKELAMLYDYQGKIRVVHPEETSYAEAHIFDRNNKNNEFYLKYDANNYELSIDNRYISDELFKLEYNTNDATYCLKLNNKQDYYSEVYHIPLLIKEYSRSSTDTQRLLTRTVSTTFMICTRNYYNTLQNYIWKHGQAGLMQLDTEVKPTNWYGKQHPFEFEFVVNKDIYNHKIFENLMILSNKATPESIHFEVVGEVYNFAKDKLNMFYRQEATKHLFQYNGYDIAYNSEYLKLNPKQRENKYSNYLDKSFLFPLRVARQDSLNEVYDYYQKMTSPTLDYQSLSGSEITYDKLLNDFNVNVHMPVYPLGGYEEVEITKSNYDYYKRTNVQVRQENGKYYKLVSYGRRLGNAEYKEDRWFIQIPSINYVEKNENKWEGDVPPLNLFYNPLPETAKNWKEPKQPFPNKEVFVNSQGEYLYKYDNTLSNKQIIKEDWGDYKQTRIRDKYMKVKIRYNGEDLAVIAAIITLFTTSV